jgi:ABC-type antimicrobial peptide transport system permease subunit
MAAALLSAFGLLAAALAAIGLYGVIAFSVSQRTREVGIRMALGARTSQVMRMVVGEALLLVAAGATIGLGLGALAGRGLAGVLLDVPAIEPVTFVTVSAILVIAALLATLLPARRAASVNPTEALRHE